MIRLRTLTPLAVAAFALAACEEEAPRVLQLNPNTFTVVASSSRDAVDARQRALADATTHCNMRGLEMAAIGGTNSTQVDWFGDRIPYHELRFQCLPHGSSVNAVSNPAPAPVQSTGRDRGDPVVVIVR